MTTPEAQAYNNGRDDMRERILQKLQEELMYMHDLDDSKPLVKLMNHLIKKIEKLP